MTKTCNIQLARLMSKPQQGDHGSRKLDSGANILQMARNFSQHPLEMDRLELNLDNDADHQSQQSAYYSNNDNSSNNPLDSVTHTNATFALCICMLSHSYLLISVVPYSGYMAVDLIDSVNEDTAGRYAGLLASSFMIGRAVTSISWGRASDIYGRTTVLYTSLGLSCVLSVLFGLSPTLGIALFVRFLMGCSNGIMSSIKTITSEMAAGDEKLESHTMSLVIGMWGLGFLVSPAIAGALAEPIKQYSSSHSTWLPAEDSLLYKVLVRHPFLLPNLLGAAMCLAGICALWLFVHETLPTEARRRPTLIFYDLLTWFGRFNPYYRIHQYQVVPVLKESASDYERQQDASIQRDDDDSTTTEPSLSSLLQHQQTRLCLGLHCAYSFVGLTIDESFPLFTMSRKAAFGLSELEIGKILALCGFVFVVFQVFVYKQVYNRFGLVGSVRVGSLLSQPFMILLPLSLWINRSSAESSSTGSDTKGSLHWITFLYLAIVLAMNRIFSYVFFTSISVLLNQSVIVPKQRGTVNGISVFGSSIAQGLGALFAGLLVSWSVSIGDKYAGLIIFGMISAMGFLITRVTWTCFIP